MVNCTDFLEKRKINCILCSVQAGSEKWKKLMLDARDEMFSGLPLFWIFVSLFFHFRGN